MADEDTKFEEFERLVQDLSNVKAKLLKLEERKNTVRESVYEKVKVDYEAKLKEVEKEIEDNRNYIEKAFNSCRSEIEDLVNKRNGIEEEIEELSLRHYLGEFDEEEYERLQQEKKDLLANLREELENSGTKIDFLKGFLPESLLETLPKEAMAISHEEATAESVEISEESVEAPVESVEAPPESEEVTKQKAPEGVSTEETVAETGEPPTEEVAEAEEGPEEQPAEMLSEEEAEKLIEEKIYPAEETADILKQPELAPEAKEKEGVECPKCGMINEPDSWYCEKCGTQLLEEKTG